jgi:hypothetical protein
LAYAPGHTYNRKRASVDQDIDINSVAAIEVYKRGGGTPTAFSVDGTCGVVAIWTGSRKP